MSIETLTDNTDDSSSISSLSEEDPEDIIIINDMNKYVNDKMEHIWNLCNECKEKHNAIVINNINHLMIYNLTKKKGKCTNCDIEFEVIQLDGELNNDKYHRVKYTATIEAWNLLCKCCYTIGKDDLSKKIENYQTKFNKKYQVVSPLLNCKITDRNDYFVAYLDDDTFTLH